MEIGIVDCGRGFEASLWRNPVYREEIRKRQRDEGREITATEAVDLALGHRVTGTPERNSGVGLFFTKKLVQQNQGRMNIQAIFDLYYPPDNDYEFFDELTDDGDDS